MTVTISPGKISGTARIPGSKSHTIRALVIAGLAEGRSVIRAPLESEDTAACVRILRNLGVEIIEERTESGELAQLVVQGAGPWLREPYDELDCGNSGTTLYLALSLVALQSFPVRLTGDEQLQRRTALPLLEALVSMGARVEYHGKKGCVPLTIQGPIRGGEVSISCPTSQYLSSLLLAAPLSPRGITINVPLLNERPYVGITLGWLQGQGIHVDRDDWSRFTVAGGQGYSAAEVDVPADFSSGTFLLVAAAITGSDLMVTGLDMEDSQGDKAVVGMLRNLGCRIDDVRNPVGLAVGGGSLSHLPGGEIDLNATPDALPALAILGTCCDAPLRLINVPQARDKETDRIAVMASVLKSLGGRADELPDGLIVHPVRLSGGTADSFGDHRVAMALAIAGLCATGPVTTTNAAVAAVTFPGFYRLLESVGATIEVVEP
ncbi:MAG: 3-phosphoshikimate 1-carboxyvinyltransferase [Spirochaetales bacterium]|nr:MAG: 3-phosphoshikimate 1-carboxyvinyltransferase [Spirochaetales bacterium]